MAVSHVLSSPNANWTGTVTVFNSQGSTTTIAATNLVRPGDWNSVHNEFYSLLGNTTGNSTASGSNVSFSAAGQFTLGGSTNTLIFSGPPFISSYENYTDAITFSQTLGGTSASVAVAFQMPEGGSFSFLRIPALMTTGSTTLGTSATTGSAANFHYYTWNAVVYAMNTGASSQSFTWVSSGSAGFTWQNAVSISNTTQMSYTQAFSYPAAGGQTNVTTQYSISNTNISFPSTFFHSNFSSLRFIDIPFAASLAGGPYWLVFGYSSSTAASSNNANITNSASFTANGVRYSNHYGISKGSYFAPMGSTNLTAGGYMGAGSFSTAGGGTTAAFPISAISSSASIVHPYFQMLRSA